MFHRGFKHSKTIKALGLRPRAFISFLVFETSMKHSHSFLKYYMKNFNKHSARRSRRNIVKPLLSESHIKQTSSVEAYEVDTSLSP